MTRHDLDHDGRLRRSLLTAGASLAVLPTIAWGQDNRTCAVRLVGKGAGARMENRVPGGDVNPYLALAAMSYGGSGALPAPISPSNESLIGPSLGKDAIGQGVKGMLVGVLAVLAEVSADRGGQPA